MNHFTGQQSGQKLERTSRILLAYNGSRLSQAALRMLIEQHRGQKRQETVPKFYTRPCPYTSGDGPGSQVSQEVVDQAAKSAAIRRIQGRDAGPDGSNFSDAIVDAAAEWGADLIVLGWHGRKALRRFFFGSIADAVTHQVQCSVRSLSGPRYCFFLCQISGRGVNSALFRPNPFANPPIRATIIRRRNTECCPSVWQGLVRRRFPVTGVVVTDKRRPRNGRFVEIVGTYDPLKKPAAVKLDAERVKYWLSCGAQPSDTVRSFFKAQQDRLDAGVRPLHGFGPALPARHRSATHFRACLHLIL